VDQTCPISKSSIKIVWYEPQIHVPTISWRPCGRITITLGGQKNFHMKAYNWRLKFKFLNFTTCAHFTVRNLNYETRIIMPVVMLACTYQWAGKTVVVHAFHLSILTTVFVKIRTGLIRLHLNKNAPECFIPPDVHHVFKGNFMCNCLAFTCYWRWFWLCVT